MTRKEGDRERALGLRIEGKRRISHSKREIESWQKGIRRGQEKDREGGKWGAEKGSLADREGGKRKVGDREKPRGRQEVDKKKVRGDTEQEGVI